MVTILSLVQTNYIQCNMGTPLMTLLSMSSRSLVDGAPARFSEGHGFYSCQGLRFFSFSHTHVVLINSLFTYLVRLQNINS